MGIFGYIGRGRAGIRQRNVRGSPRHDVAKRMALVEAHDVLIIALGAIILLGLTRLPRAPILPVDRGSLDALVAQLSTLQHERADWQTRAENAEARCAQLQAMVDNLLPQTVNDRQVIETQRQQLQERGQELDGLKAGLGLR